MALRKRKTKFEIVSVGSAVRDVVFYTDASCIVPNPDSDPTKERLLCFEFGAKIRSSDVRFGFGGGAANSSINFVGLGFRAAALVSVSDDFDGRAIEQQLRSRGVSSSLIHVSKKHRTGLSFLVVDKATSEHTAYVYYGCAADLDFSLPELKRNPTEWYYVSAVPSPGWKGLFTHLIETDSKIAWNPGGKQLKAGYKGLRTFLKRTSILIVNKDEAAELTMSHPDCDRPGTIKQMLKRIQSWGPEVVLITNSQKGSTAYDGQNYYHRDSPHDSPVDTTGAGDCFGSSFTAGIIRYKGDIARAMELAQKNATSVVHSVGAQNGFITWDKLPKNLRKV
ncbi:MAG: hypothetical protein COW24_05965 [Candidatus Kerfeldbacteria bacterium CG15_BIG_FIL_POST_REV_8_21_14_020_45_12]|uniref:Carbohydrate kinase PfkB domain-containing protein n=1 Tax=Candidatus Kerfeldbacteria bacterium CG15_BIG_FIL_POST_REV_8_21_14_020_45_12 TaxID=2014247 RepID=A0A2M7H267_9BACT|nr:MAG: hypothetical protein COW24_05965 [Candidatus Kerfeldbacteria bacterium CG15_BIG_FIL_POST_REV_8_21_14_020_45_12]PJA92970.1 MAG: hypothetical protein CO132_05215 [Candidatus Kerfeldbacteria bacterium CG_4_9_14_3_um_filter_45_8]